MNETFDKFLSISNKISEKQDEIYDLKKELSKFVADNAEFFFKDLVFDVLYIDSLSSFIKLQTVLPFDIKISFVSYEEFFGVTIDMYGNTLNCEGEFKNIIAFFNKFNIKIGDANNIKDSINKYSKTVLEYEKLYVQLNKLKGE